jgi:regulator of nucleoside diphosphate kinase
MRTRPPIVLSRFDHERLERLLESQGKRGELAELREELDRAEIVEPEQIPPNVVTMNSVVRFCDAETRAENEVTLVFPAHADADRGRISILAPVGSALLGLSVGDSIDWPLPDGRSRRLRVVSVTYQPEAAGEYRV